MRDSNPSPLRERSSISSFLVRGSKYDIYFHNHSKQSAKDISAKGGKFLPYTTSNARLGPFNDRMGTHQISSVVKTSKIREPVTFEYLLMQRGVK